MPLWISSVKESLRRGSLGSVGDRIADQRACPARIAQGVDVSVSGQDVLIDDPVAVAVYADAPLHAKNKIALRSRPSQHPRIVELMAADLGADRVVGVFAFDGHNGIAVALGPLE